MLIHRLSSCTLRCTPSGRTQGSPALTHRVMDRAASTSGKRSRTQAAVQSEQTYVAQAGPSTQQRQQQQPSPAYDVSASDSDSDSGPLRVPLKLVVQDAVKRWFSETLSEARRGDVKQQALLAQMLAQGYGGDAGRCPERHHAPRCKQDLEESRRWAERARVRGYSMSGVYCEL